MSGVMVLRCNGFTIVFFLDYLGLLLVLERGLIDCGETRLFDS